MDEPYYLYAITWADCRLEGFGPGVDPRFPVELVRHGELAALASRVGLDQFDLSKLQEGTADLRWLSKVAVRHNEVVGALAVRSPAVPMRLGTLFASRASLIARMTLCGPRAAEFLRQLEDRQEWAVKIYFDEGQAEKAACHVQPHFEPARLGGGAQYLAARGVRLQRRRQMEAEIRHVLSAVEDRLQHVTDAWRRLRALPANLTNRPEKMIWNAAFLVSSAHEPPFETACRQLGKELSTRGLILETTGPWPAYHFCPAMEPERQDRAPATAVH